MADDKERGNSAGDIDMKAASTSTSPTTAARKRKGLMSRLWTGIFRQSEDFEKRLQDISKEEAAVLARMKKRSIGWKRMTRHLIMFSVIFEAIAVGYAILTTRTLDMDWKMRAFRVLPMFILPALSAAAYSTLVGFTKMCDRKDQKTLERLRAERQAKIDELKERTNYYTTQQLIQRYDPDPAAKAAAATVLASKLGADSGLTMYLGDESKGHASTGKSHDAEHGHGQHGGLRNRKQYTRSNSTGSSPALPKDEIKRPVSNAGTEGHPSPDHNQLVVNHCAQGPASYDGGWLARFAALLVGEDPTQSYALICGNCNMHNGLARKEDFPYVTYYCPHCRALNRAKQSEELVSQEPNQPISCSATPVAARSGNDDVADGSAIDSALTGNTPKRAGPEIEEVTENAVAAGDQ